MLRMNYPRDARRRVAIILPYGVLRLIFLHSETCLRRDDRRRDARRRFGSLFSYDVPKLIVALFGCCICVGTIGVATLGVGFPA
jgi:hypothetical protein